MAASMKVVSADLGMANSSRTSMEADSQSMPTATTTALPRFLGPLARQTA